MFLVANEENGPGPKSRTVSPTNTTATHHSDEAYSHPNAVCDSPRERFTRAYYRQLRFACGCYGQCRCEFDDDPTPKRTDGYRDALDHLAALGYPGAALLPECRQLWSRGGADRELAADTVRWWSA